MLALALTHLFLLVERVQADEDHNEEADLIHEFNEDYEVENDPTEDDDNDYKSGIIFKEFRFVFSTLL